MNFLTKIQDTVSSWVKNLKPSAIKLPKSYVNNNFEVFTGFRVELQFASASPLCNNIVKWFFLIGVKLKSAES